MCALDRAPVGPKDISFPVVFLLVVDALLNLNRVKPLLHDSFNFGPLIFFVNPSTTHDDMCI